MGLAGAFREDGLLELQLRQPVFPSQILDQLFEGVIEILTLAFLRVRGAAVSLCLRHIAIGHPVTHQIGIGTAEGVEDERLEGPGEHFPLIGPVILTKILRIPLVTAGRDAGIRVAAAAAGDQAVIDRLRALQVVLGHGHLTLALHALVVRPAAQEIVCTLLDGLFRLREPDAQVVHELANIGHLTTVSDRPVLSFAQEIVQRMTPLMRHCAVTLGVRDVDDRGVSGDIAFLVRDRVCRGEVRGVATMAEGADRECQPATETHVLRVCTEANGQIHQGVIAVVQVILALLRGNGIADRDRREPECLAHLVRSDIGASTVVLHAIALHAIEARAAQRLLAVRGRLCLLVAQVTRLHLACIAQGMTVLECSAHESAERVLEVAPVARFLAADLERRNLLQFAFQGGHSRLHVATAVEQASNGADLLDVVSCRLGEFSDAVLGTRFCDTALQRLLAGIERSVVVDRLTVEHPVVDRLVQARAAAAGASVVLLAHHLAEGEHLAAQVFQQAHGTGRLAGRVDRENIGPGSFLQDCLDLLIEDQADIPLLAAHASDLADPAQSVADALDLLAATAEQCLTVVRLQPCRASVIALAQVFNVLRIDVSSRQVRCGLAVDGMVPSQLERHCLLVVPVALWVVDVQGFCVGSLQLASRLALGLFAVCTRLALRRLGHCRLEKRIVEQVFAQARAVQQLLVGFGGLRVATARLVGHAGNDLLGQDTGQFRAEIIRRVRGSVENARIAQCIHIDGRLDRLGVPLRVFRLRYFFNPLNFSLPPFGRLRNHASRDGPPCCAEPEAFALGFVPLEGFICCFDVLSDSIAELHSGFRDLGAVRRRVLEHSRLACLLCKLGGALSHAGRLGQDDKLIT